MIVFGGLFECFKFFCVIYGMRFCLYVFVCVVLEGVLEDEFNCVIVIYVRNFVLRFSFWVGMLVNGGG